MSTITLNLEIPLTDDDRKVLSTLLGDAPVIEVPALKEAPEKAPAKKAPAKKSAPAKKAPEKAPEADDEPDEFASDEAVKESAPKKKAPVKKDAAPAPAEDGDKRKTAIDLGAAALGEGRADDVRAALGSLGASRVSQLKDDQLDAFIEALS